METVTFEYTKLLEALTAGNGRATLTIRGKTYIVFTKQALKELSKRIGNIFAGILNFHFGNIIYNEKKG